MRKIIYSFFIFTGLITSCKVSKDLKINSEGQNINNVKAISLTIIYKTTKDYNDLVPVMMNPERTKIISYPAPSDLYFQNLLAKPILLKNGYLLDNRGIGENVVFLKYTYEEYSKLSQAPSLDEMMTKIADKYPLKELFYCGKRTQYKEDIKELNAIIDSGFSGCRKVPIIPMSVTLD